MARARLLKPGFFTNELLAELPFAGRLLFAGLWILADKEGRLEDRPRRIKAELFPWDEVDTTQLLADLAERGFILRYQVEGQAVIQIVKFHEHQSPHVRETPSHLPSHEKASLSQDEASPRSPVPVPILVPKSVPVVSSEVPSEPAFLAFPVIGTGLKSWALSEAQAVSWIALFPGLDVRSEMRKALAWVQANQGHRKTAAGMSRFLVGWLNRAADRGVPRHEVVSGQAGWVCPHQPPCLKTGWECERDWTLEQARQERAGR